MKTLLIDIGNSTVDFRVLGDGKIEKLLRPNTSNVFYQNYKVYLDYLKGMKINKIIYSCVVLMYDEIIINLARELGIEAKKVTYKDLDEKLLDIDDKTQIGGDFIANFIAINAMKKSDYLCISMGTATTFFLVKNGIFKGATISPGIEIGAKSLFSNANLLSEVPWKETEDLIGKNTNDALTIGIVNSHFYMIDAMIKKIKEKYNIKDVVFTGGNCYKVLSLIKYNQYNFIEDLIFQGLKLFA
ncbi:type III pantothenate kinase [Spiroplasma endosymbiont of Aspidapion aeneum]|uniref:type III pantothenate kinase n=1 Tax=Spiroplasma endosymbiont of Aspidapion aeneum TaxID=3066276 RepID=UPI00313ADB96